MAKAKKQTFKYEKAQNVFFMHKGNIYRRKIIGRVYRDNLYMFIVNDSIVFIGEPLVYKHLSDLMIDKMIIYAHNLIEQVGKMGLSDKQFDKEMENITKRFGELLKF